MRIKFIFRKTFRNKPGGPMMECLGSRDKRFIIARLAQSDIQNEFLIDSKRVKKYEYQLVRISDLLFSSIKSALHVEGDHVILVNKNTTTEKLREYLIRKEHFTTNEDPLIVKFITNRGDYVYVTVTSAKQVIRDLKPCIKLTYGKLSFESAKA